MAKRKRFAVELLPDAAQMAALGVEAAMRPFYSELLKEVVMTEPNNPHQGRKKLLTSAEILDTVDTQVEEIFVEDWGGIVLVRGLTGTERDRFEASVAANGKMNLENIRAKLAILSIVDEKGNRVFTDKDAGRLGTKSARALDLIFDVARRLSGLKKEDVEALTKNSSTAQSGDSGLD